MTEIDTFANSLLEEAKRFLEKAGEEDEPGRSAYLHASLLLAFCAIEAHLNAISEDFLSRKELTPHELGLMCQKEVRLVKGIFEVQNSLKMVRIEERIEFLNARFSGQPINYSDAWWSRLSEAIKLRNKLTHPKEQVTIDVGSVGGAIQAIVDSLEKLYKSIYKSGFPASGLKLDSQLDF